MGFSASIAPHSQSSLGAHRSIAYPSDAGVSRFSPGLVLGPVLVLVLVAFLLFSLGDSSTLTVSVTSYILIVVSARSPVLFFP